MEYVRSLIKTVFSKQNIGFIIFMIINMLPFIFVYVRQSILYASIVFIIVFVLYFLFLLSAGEIIARFMLGAMTRIKLDERTTISIAFSNAYVIAKRKNSIISNNIRLYVYEGTVIDAYAIGRHTICLSSATLNLPEQDLVTLLLMKFAQFSHHDSEILAVLTAGNVWYIAMAIICKWHIYLLGLIAWLFHTIIGNSFGKSAIGRWVKAMADAVEKIILIFVKVILMFGVGSYKNNIYTNDIFVCDCGFKNDLIRFLQYFEPEQVGHKTLFGTINSMKPDKHLRLEKVQNYTPRSNNINGFKIICR